MTDRELKKEMRKRNKERKEKQKAYLKSLEQEDEELEEEYERDHPDINKVNKENILDVLFNKEEEEEYRSYLAEAELEEELRLKKEDRNTLIRAAITLVVGIIALITGLKIYLATHKNYIDANIRPKIEEYYKNRYNEDIVIETIEEVMYEYKDETNTKQKEPTGIYKTTTESGNHVLISNDGIIGDDISTTGISNDFLSYMSSNMQNAGIIGSQVNLSYEKFYRNYNKYDDSISALPGDKNLVDLFNDGNLTAEYKAVYQYDLDMSILVNTMNMLSENSAFYLIKQEFGYPTLITMIKKNSIYTLDVRNPVEKEDGIFTYELDQEKNEISTVDITKVSTTSMIGLDDYSFNRAYMFTPNKRKGRRDDKDKEFTKYFLVRLKDDLLNVSKIRQISGSIGSTYSEKTIDKYENVIIIESGGYIYILSDSKNLTLAEKGSKKTLLCKFGIC